MRRLVILRWLILAWRQMQKVGEYLDTQRNQPVIQQLRKNKPLTAQGMHQNMQELATNLMELGGDEGKDLLTDLLKRQEAPSLIHFIRSQVGLEQAVAKTAFAGFLKDPSLSAPQLRFIAIIIEQLITRGILNSGALYQSPFSNLHAGGPEALFAGKESILEAVFETLESFTPDG